MNIEDLIGFSVLYLIVGVIFLFIVHIATDEDHWYYSNNIECKEDLLKRIVIVLGYPLLVVYCFCYLIYSCFDYYLRLPDIREKVIVVNYLLAQLGSKFCGRSSAGRALR